MMSCGEVGTVTCFSHRGDPQKLWNTLLGDGYVSFSVVETSKYVNKEEHYMKRFIMALLAVGIFLSGCATREYVQKQVDPIRKKVEIQERACCFAPKSTPFLDLDSDQKISYNEYNHFLETLFTAVERKLDRNDDKTISSDEYVAGKFARRYIFVTTRMDADADGWITPEEFKQYYKKRVEGILSIFDVNRDRKITRNEFLSHNQKKFTAMDKNSDMLVDPNELNTYFEMYIANRKTRKLGSYAYDYCLKPDQPGFCMSHPISAPKLGRPEIGSSWWGRDEGDGDSPPDECFVTDFFDECFNPWPEDEEEKSASSLGFFFK